jgi:hypothetical protein
VSAYDCARRGGASRANHHDDADVGALAASRVARNACDQCAKAMGRQLIEKR